MYTSRVELKYYTQSISIVQPHNYGSIHKFKKKRQRETIIDLTSKLKILYHKSTATYSSFVRLEPYIAVILLYKNFTTAQFYVKGLRMLYTAPSGYPLWPLCQCPKSPAVLLAHAHLNALIQAYAQKKQLKPNKH